MSPDQPRAERPDYELLDAGDGRRLERFGDHVVDRPAPAAIERPLAPARWPDANLRFEPETGWNTSVEPWSIQVAGVTLQLRAAPSGGLGFFPEHLANVAWLVAQVRSLARDRKPAVLNLFAHTGLATLAAAQAGATVAHVDAARSAVTWARGNAARSGLADRAIRWLVDDAATFLAREARRGRRYDGIVLDPPSFGRAGNRRWQLGEELPALLEACRAVAVDDAFVLLTAHTTGLAGDGLAQELESAFGKRGKHASIDVLPLVLDASSGATLDLGWAARLTR
jgi:23S rRNA (cytosine1962-C5)-methyltransferase